jgi:hypothetical protein
VIYFFIDAPVAPKPPPPPPEVWEKIPTAVGHYILFISPFLILLLSVASVDIGFDAFFGVRLLPSRASAS